MDKDVRIAELEMALRELMDAVHTKASGRANPSTYYSPRMEAAIFKAEQLLNR